MKRISLTQEKFALVDDEDFDGMNQYRWFASKISGHWYAKRKTILMHRFLMDFPRTHTDHVDGNGLNNQKFNLRVATYTQNQGNSKIRIDNTSGYKGVSWHTKNARWQVLIRFKGKKI